VTVKAFIMLKKISISNKCSSFDLSIYQRMLKCASRVETARMACDCLGNNS